MADYYVAPEAAFTAVADAIRAKTGGSAELEFPDEFVEEIESIETGGGEPDHWIRPSDWPDLSKLDRTGEVVYITCLADETYGWICLNVRSTDNDYTKVAIGDIVNGSYVVDAEFTIRGYISDTRIFFGTQNGGYKVIRVTPTEGKHITGFRTGEAYEYGYTTNAIGDYPVVNVIGQWSGVLEVYGNLPYCQYAASARTCKLLRSFDVKNVAPDNINYCFAYCNSLENVDVSTWDTSSTTTFDSAFRDCPIKYFKGYKNLNVGNVTSFSLMMAGIALDEIDITGWTISKATTMNSMLQNSKVKTVKLKSSSVGCVYNGIFNGCTYLKSVDLTNFNTSLGTKISNIFEGTKSLRSVDFGGLNLSNVTETNACFRNSGVKSVTIPASLAIISANSFQGMELCSEFHFLATTPPTLDNTNAFNNMSTRVTKTIYVPYSADHSVLNAYKTATNWSTYADYIQEEPQS